MPQPFDQTGHATPQASAMPLRRSRDLGFYLAHCSEGRSIRSVADEASVAPSTVSRAVRRIEAWRDDPLADFALAQFENAITSSIVSKQIGESLPMKNDDKPTKLEISVLGRLAEPEAFLMIAKGAEKAGVFCRTNNFRRPLNLLPISTASRFLTRDWVRCIGKSELSAKYALTEAGRAALGRFQPTRRPVGGFAEAPSVFAAQHQLAGQRRITNPTTGEIETIQVNLGESPLGWLSRRRDANGDPLLSPEEVEAGERLREDYELAQIGPKVGQDWRRFLTPVASGSAGAGRTPSEGPMFARDRVAKALDVLGPGLSDAAVRICCFLEGLEATERRMGWSARSGKVVLKLALQRLVDHYGLASKEKAA